MSVLKASEYLKGMKYGIITKNNYDTLSGKLMLNEDSSDTLVASQDITVSPSWTAAFDRQAYQKNYSLGHYFFTQSWYDMAISNVAVQMAKTTVQFRNLATPIVGGTYAKLSFAGTTYKIPRGNNFEMGDVFSFYKDANQISTFIRDHNRRESSDWTNNSVSVDYSTGKLNMFAWIKKAVKSNITDINTYVDPEGDEYANNKPDANDILTSWVGGPAGYKKRCATNHPRHYNLYGGIWSYNDQDLNFPATYPNPIATGFDDTQEAVLVEPMLRNPLIQSIAYKEEYEYIKTNVIRYDDYNFDVEVIYPVKYQYMAVSRIDRRPTFLSAQQREHLDSYAFEDSITKVTVELYGTVYDENAEGFANSLNAAGGVIDPANKNILKLSNNELLTKGATWSGRNWKDSAVEYILDRHRKGLSIIELDIPAEFAIENDIKINSAFQIKLLDNTLAERGYRIATYEVKNITKRYNNSQFTWNLKLLENKDLSTPEIDGARMIYFSEYHGAKVGFYKSLAWENVTAEAIQMYDTGLNASGIISHNVAQKGIGIKLPQVPSEDFTADIGAVLLEDLEDKDLRRVSIAVVVKVPFYARGSWWNTDGTTKFNLGYFVRSYETSAVPVYASEADHYEASILVSDEDNTLNDYCEYHTMVLKVPEAEYKQGIVPFFYSNESTNYYLSMSTMQMQWYVIDSGSVTANEAFDYLKDNNILDDYFREDYTMPTARMLNVSLTDATEYQDDDYYYEIDLTEVIDTDEYIVDALTRTPSTLEVYEIINDIDDKRIVFVSTTQLSAMTAQLLILKNPSQEGDPNV